MDLTISVPRYNPDTGLVCEFEEGFCIDVHINDDLSVCISANKGGLITLAKLLLTMSSDLVPDGVHIHLDSYNGLEEGSHELIISKETSLMSGKNFPDKG